MALQSIRLLLWLLALWRNAALEQSYTEPCRVLRMFLFSLPKTLRVLYDGIFTSNLCALFSHPEKLVPKTPRQATSQTQDLICTCSAHLRVFLGGWGKGNLKPMDLDGETCGICALSDGHALAAKTWCTHGRSTVLIHMVMLFPEIWPQQEWHSQVALKQTGPDRIGTIYGTRWGSPNISWFIDPKYR